MLALHKNISIKWERVRVISGTLYVYNTRIISRANVLIYGDMPYYKAHSLIFMATNQFVNYIPTYSIYRSFFSSFFLLSVTGAHLYLLFNIT